MTCVAEGGYLAIIDDDVEADVIKHIMSENPDSENFGFKKDQVMIGFHDWGHRGASFMTIHGKFCFIVTNIVCDLYFIS